MHQPERAPLASLLVAALANPGKLGRPEVERVATSFDPKAESATLKAALDVLAAMAYGRPDLLTPDLLRRTVTLFDADLPPEILESWSNALSQAVFTPAAQTSAELALEGLKRESTRAQSRTAWLKVLKNIAFWHPEFLTLERLVALAARPWLAGQRNEILNDLVERLVFVQPERFDASIVERIMTTFAGTRRLAYTLSFLSAQPTVPAPIRAKIE